MNDRGRSTVLALLAIAVLIGGFLRFFDLGASEITPDEAASWAAAAAPTVSEVVRRSAEFNPGKLAAYDLVLHGWIQVFGNGVPAMRTLSAMLGMVAIGLVFWITRDVLALSTSRESSQVSIDYVAALSALLFAVTMAMVRYTREARMYPLLMAAILTQTGFLLRSHRRGGLINYVAMALFTALAIATNFTAVFLFVAQGLWLVLSGEARRDGIAWRPLAALAAGGVVLLPFAGGAVHGSVSALDQGALNWISHPSPWEPFTFFNRSAGTLPFPVLLALAVWGTVSGWRRMRAAVVFVLFWMWGPVLLLFITSIVVTPMLVERYALSSLVAFMILAALGIHECPSPRIRAIAIVLIVALSVGHVAGFLRKPPSLQWTHAIERIRTNSPAVAIAIAPPHGANVLRYYLGARGQYAVSGLSDDSCAKSDILFLWDHALSGPSGKQAEACRANFGHLLFKEKDVTVLTRQAR